MVQTIENRPLAAQVTELEVTPTLGGVIVRAAGVAETAGAFSAELTLASQTPESITLDLRAFQGRGTGGGRLAVARFFTDGELGSARTISVRSATNTLSRRR
ncbi:MAG: hypothetical protein AAGF13_03665 [Pseudomonadota bacterium]